MSLLMLDDVDAVVYMVALILAWHAVADVPLLSVLFFLESLSVSDEDNATSQF